MWLEGIAYPTPAKNAEELKSREEAKEEAHKPRALKMGNGGEKCDAMGEKCEWSDLAVDTTCVVCKKSMHRMCGDKFDDGVELEDEVRFKCDKCSAVNPL